MPLRRFNRWFCGIPPVVVFSFAAIQTVVFICQVEFITWSVQNWAWRRSKVATPKKSYLPPEQYKIPSDFTFQSSDYTHCADKTRSLFWNCLQPGFQCPPGLLRRVGRKRDGGKWTCGLDYFGNSTRSRNAIPCNVYSFGVNGESSFEDVILRTTNCKVFAYDPSVSKIGQPINPNNPRVKFVKKGIDGLDHFNVRTLATFMEQNGQHQWIDILKIDVESSEFATLESIFETFEELPFGQLLIEFHEYLDIYPNSTSWIVSLLERMQEKGLRLFQTENNYIYDDAAEFSFINVKAITWFMSERVFKDNFLSKQ